MNKEMLHGIRIEVAPPTDAAYEALIGLSEEWAAEQSCYGYRANVRVDLEGRRVIWALGPDGVAGYLLGRTERAQKMTSVMPDQTPYFELEELYVRPAYRDIGLGRRLFSYAEAAARADGLPFLMLSTAAKNARAILHFYLDELGMSFWSARLYKELKDE